DRRTQAGGDRRVDRPPEGRRRRPARPLRRGSGGAGRRGEARGAGADQPPEGQGGLPALLRRPRPGPDRPGGQGGGPGPRRRVEGHGQDLPRGGTRSAQADRCRGRAEGAGALRPAWRHRLKKEGTNHRVTEGTEARHTERTADRQGRRKATGWFPFSLPVSLSVSLRSVSSVTLWFVPPKGVAFAAGRGDNALLTRPR